MAKGSDRPSDHFEDDKGRGFFQGRLTARDADTAGGADTEKTVRTPAVRKAFRKMQTPKGKGQK